MACELPTLEGLLDFGKCCPDDRDFIFDRISIRLADKEDSRKILDEFDLGSDRTIYMSYLPSNLSYTYSYNGENVVRMMATSILIGSSDDRARHKMLDKFDWIVCIIGTRR